jgi:hypothetical protein
VLIEYVISIALLIGAFFILVGSIGLLRLRDFYARLHAPTKATTVGLGAILIASMAYFALVRGTEEGDGESKAGIMDSLGCVLGASRAADSAAAEPAAAAGRQARAQTLPPTARRAQRIGATDRNERVPNALCQCLIESHRVSPVRNRRVAPGGIIRPRAGSQGSLAVRRGSPVLARGLQA